MTSRHITMEYPAKQIQFEPLPLICCRSILLFSFFFPSELEINNSAGNRSVLVANSLTSHPISFALSSLPLFLSSSLSPVLSPPYFLHSSFPAPFVSTCVCLLCVYVHLHPIISACLCGWWFTSYSAHFPLHSTFPSLLFFLSFIHISPSSVLLPQIPSVVAVTWSPQMTWSIHGSTGRWGTAPGASPMWAWCTRRSTATPSAPPRAWRPWPTCTRLTWNARGTPSWITWRASTSSSSSCSIRTTARTTPHHRPHPPTPAWGEHQSGLHGSRYRYPMSC